MTSDGELKKRILQWIDDDKVSYYDTNGNDIADLQKVLDEAKKEYNEMADWPIEEAVFYINEWFKKWFGE